MTKRVFAVAAVVAAALAWAGVPASAQTYPPNSITVDDSTPTPGQAITVTLRTCRPGVPVDLAFGRRPRRVARRGFA
jgi:hypothetical protein